MGHRHRWISACFVLVAGCATTPVKPPVDPVAQKASTLYRQGLELRAQGKHEAALEAFEQARETRWAPLVDVQIARTLDALERANLACRYWLSLNETSELKTDDPQAWTEATARAGECWARGLGLPWPAIGPADAPVTIVEFSDYQCPFCGKVQATLRKLMEAYPGQVRMVYMHFPLAFHKQAKGASLAAVAAQRQGQFRAMHELLWERQRELRTSPWPAFAEELGLDSQRFAADVNDAGTAKYVERQMAIGKSLGVRGTPNFFINGKKLSGAQPYERFSKEVENAIGEADAELKKGTPKWRLHEVLSEKRNARYAAVMVRGEKVPDLPPPSPPPVRPRPDDKTVYKVELTGDEPTRGNKDALVTLVEFSDFQCPFCARASGTLAKLLERYPKELRIVFVHHPLPFHRDAVAAHKASMAAQRQGRFAPFYEKLMANQRSLTRKNFVAWAKALKLKTRKFTRVLDREDKALQAILDRDKARAAKVGATGTPTFFVNGLKIVGAQPEDRFRLIDEELAKARALVASGVKRKDVYGKTIAAGKVETPLEETVHTFDHKGRPGIGKGNVTVTVFGDYQCPYCKRLEPALKALVETELPGKVRVVFVQLPLAFHKQAKNAAKAALAAHRMGKFEAMHDKLYDEARALTDVIYPALAEGVGLDVKRFTELMTSDAIAKAVDEDIALSRKTGVNGTPTIFVNGRRYKGRSRSARAMAEIIKAEYLD